jgi:hypothetical protein
MFICIQFLKGLTKLRVGNDSENDENDGMNTLQETRTNGGSRHDSKFIFYY